MSQRSGRPLNIGIVGAGTAGPAAARFLAAQGHRITLWEKVAEPAPVGAGITLQPTGLTVLRELGLLAPILKAGQRIDRLYGRTQAGRTVLDMSYRALHPELFGLGIHRGALFQALYSDLESLGVELRCGDPISSFAHVHEGASVQTQGGQEATYDLLLVADGARSPLRKHTRIERKVRRYEWGALWTVLPLEREPDEQSLFAHTLSQVFSGTSQFVGFLPTGRAPNSDSQVMSLFWSIKEKEMTAFKKHGAEYFKDRVRQLTHARSSKREQGDIDALLSHLEDADQLLPAAYHDVVLAEPNEGHVVFLGDAAHAMSPQLGQGANLALYDAWTLQQLIAERVNTPPDIPEALKGYAVARKNHLRFYQFTTRLLTPFFQSDFWPLGSLRDLTMGALCRLPFFRTQGLGSMAGYKTGVFGAVPFSRRLAAGGAERR